MIRRFEAASFIAVFVFGFATHAVSQGKSDIQGQLLTANDMLMQGKLTEARQKLNKIQKEFPNDPRPYYFLGVVSLQEDKTEEAKDDFRRALEIYPEFAPAHWTLGSLLVDEGKLDEGIQELREAVKSESGVPPQVHLDLADALNARGDAGGALKEYQVVQQMDPSHYLAPSHLFSGHTSRVWTLKFSRDSLMLASGSLDQTVKVWDVASGEQRAKFSFDANAWPIDFSPNGELLVTGSGDPDSKSYTFKIWELRSNAEAKEPRLPAKARPIKFSPDWHFMASYQGDGKIEFWDFRQMTPLHTVNSGDSPFMDYGRFSNDGQLFCAPGASNEAKVWEVATGKLLYTAHGDPAAAEEGIVAVFFNGDGSQLTFVDSHKNVKVADIKTGHELKSIPVDMGGLNIVEYVGLSPDGNWLAAESRGGVALLTNLGEGRTLILPGRRGMANAVAFSPDGKWLATASYRGEVRLWKVPSSGEQSADGPK